MGVGVCRDIVWRVDGKGVGALYIRQQLTNCVLWDGLIAPPKVVLDGSEVRCEFGLNSEMVSVINAGADRFRGTVWPVGGNVVDGLFIGALLANFVIWDGLITPPMVVLDGSVVRR
mgnify:CR=1 FL=1